MNNAVFPTRPLFDGLRIGLLGGAFNPAHAGHAAISLAAMKALRLDWVWWLVSPDHPTKDPGDLAPLARRLAGAQEAAAAYRHILPTAIEAELGTRYTADTLAALGTRFPRTAFFWLMGADNAITFHQWKRWRRIPEYAEVVVCNRPGYLHRAARGTMALTLRHHGGWTLIPTTHIPLSATEIREKLGKFPFLG